MTACASRSVSAVYSCTTPEGTDRAAFGPNPPVWRSDVRARRCARHVGQTGQARRAWATLNSAMLAATPALSDSIARGHRDAGHLRRRRAGPGGTALALGADDRTSGVGQGRARRPRRRRRRPGRRRSSPPSRYASSARARLVARATGMRAAAPAEVFHAPAVIPAAAPLGHQHAVRAERRHRADDGAEVARVGDAVERDDQRRSRPARAARVEQVVGVRRSRTAGPAARGPGGRPRRSSGRARCARTPAAGCPRSAAILSASRTRSSESIREATQHVQRRAGHARAQRLDDRVAAGDHLGRVAPGLARRARRTPDRGAPPREPASARLAADARLARPSGGRCRSLAFGRRALAPRAPAAAGRPSRRSGPSCCPSLRIAPCAGSCPPSGVPLLRERPARAVRRCPRPRSRLPPAGRGSRRPRAKSLSVRAAARASSRPARGASTASRRPASPAPPRAEAHCSVSGSTPRTSSIARTGRRGARAPSRGRRGQRGVALAHRLVHGGQRRRHAEVVVHRGDERAAVGAGHRGLDAARRPPRPAATKSSIRW